MGCVGVAGGGSRVWLHIWPCQPYPQLAESGNGGGGGGGGG